jgi:hypothetical protein
LMENSAGIYPSRSPSLKGEQTIYVRLGQANDAVSVLVLRAWNWPLFIARTIVRLHGPGSRSDHLKASSSGRIELTETR